MSKFQLAVMGILTLSIVGGLVSFSLFSSSKDDSLPGNTNGRVVIWGVYDSGVMNALIRSVSDEYEAFSVQYVQKRADRFDTELIEALASGVGPDVVLLQQDSLMRHYDKLYAVPYESFSERAFKDTYIQAGEMYLASNGVVGFPFLVDPLVMFWNRSIFNSEALARPPTVWEEFQDLSRTMTRLDASRNVTRATVALGEYENITNAKQILATLFFQSGNPISRVTSQGLTSVLSEENSIASPLQFYTGFADPVRPFYTWNRSLPASRNGFIAGDIALYFGFGSEIRGIRTQNPNLNFDIAVMPQPMESSNRVTFGNVQALSILRSTRNFSGAFVAVQMLTSKSVMEQLANVSNLPPVRRDMYVTQTDSFKSVLYESALISKAWLDPDRTQTSSIFSELIGNITSGRLRTDEAVRRADSLIDSLY
ncbi:MAG: extracellular solute-binding protein [Candidatus Paceibacterota bacterium]